MSDDVDAEAPTRPPLRIVAGRPTPEELAVITALVSAGGGAPEPAAAPAPRGGWSDPARQHRGPLVPGPNAWRAQAW